MLSNAFFIQLILSALHDENIINTPAVKSQPCFIRVKHEEMRISSSDNFEIIPIWEMFLLRHNALCTKDCITECLYSIQYKGTLFQMKAPSTAF